MDSNNWHLFHQHIIIYRIYCLVLRLFFRTYSWREIKQKGFPSYCMKCIILILLSVFLFFVFNKNEPFPFRKFLYHDSYVSYIYIGNVHSIYDFNTRVVSLPTEICYLCKYTYECRITISSFVKHILDYWKHTQLIKKSW